MSDRESQWVFEDSHEESLSESEDMEGRNIPSLEQCQFSESADDKPIDLSQFACRDEQTQKQQKRPGLLTVDVTSIGPLSEFCVALPCPQCHYSSLTGVCEHGYQVKKIDSIKPSSQDFGKYSSPGDYVQCLIADAATYEDTPTLYPTPNTSPNVVIDKLQLPNLERSNTNVVKLQSNPRKRQYEISRADLLEAGPSSLYRDSKGNWRSYTTHCRTAPPGRRPYLLSRRRASTRRCSVPARPRPNIIKNRYCHLSTNNNDLDSLYADRSGRWRCYVTNPLLEGEITPPERGTPVPVARGVSPDTTNPIDSFPENSAQK